MVRDFLLYHLMCRTMGQKRYNRRKTEADMGMETGTQERDTDGDTGGGTDR